jgi:putative transcriptional regulator
MDKEIKAGLLLSATALLDDTVFEKAHILITEFNTNGALGFVVNKPFGRSLTELAEFKNGRPFPLYEGGPVDQQHLFFIHQRPDLIEDGTAVGNGIYYSGNFKQAVEAVNSTALTSAQLKIFVGYCGWDAGELEAEIAEGSWEPEDAVGSLVFQ